MPLEIGGLRIVGWDASRLDDGERFV